MTNRQNQQIVKRCPRCGESKPLDDFHVRRKAKCGRASWCKECILGYQKTAWERRQSGSNTANPAISNTSNSRCENASTSGESKTVGIDRRPPLTAEEKDIIVEMRENGCSHARIALKLNRSASTITWYCMMQGIESPKSKAKSWDAIKGPAVQRRGNSLVRRFTPEEDAELLSMEAEGLSIPEIGRALKRRDHSIRYRLIVLARRDERRLCSEGE